jgi:hypothetical protein
VDELLLDAVENKDLIMRLSNTFGIVTSESSLLVLESLGKHTMVLSNTKDSYLEYEIEPPASLPELREQYNVLVAEKRLRERFKAEEKLRYVMDMWSNK